jgi:dolichol-phosphate mannosyltransferase
MTIDPNTRPLPRFAIVLPMYNEQVNARACVCGIDGYLSGLGVDYGIIAVDDGSTDATFAELTRLATEVPALRVVRHPLNGGYGAANRTGFATAVEAGFGYALVMDADGTQDPRFISDFFPAMRGGVDFIKATRYAAGSRVEGVDARRRAVSWFGNRLAGALLGIPITDFTNGFRAIKAELLARLATQDRGFSVLMEEVVQARALGASFAEVSYTLTARGAEGSVSKFNYSWSVYRDYLKHLLRPRA